jgi:hypothetical protein
MTETAWWKASMPTSTRDHRQTGATRCPAPARSRAPYTRRRRRRAPSLPTRGRRERRSARAPLPNTAGFPPVRWRNRRRDAADHGRSADERPAPRACSARPRLDGKLHAEASDHGRGFDPAERPARAARPWDRGNARARGAPPRTSASRRRAPRSAWRCRSGRLMGAQPSRCASCSWRTTSPCGKQSRACLSGSRACFERESDLTVVGQAELRRRRRSATGEDLVPPAAGRP